MKRLWIAVVVLTLLPVAAGAATEQVLWSFGDKKPDGRYPTGGLISVNGTLYGTTYEGGRHNKYGTCVRKGSCGVVFSLDPGTGAEKVQWSFGNVPDGSNPQAGLISVKGTLYGTTEFGGNGSCGRYRCGTVFSLDPATGTEKVLWSFGGANEGIEPVAGLIFVKGTLYGTTNAGGQYGYGTVFSLDPKTDTEKVLWSFGNGNDGRGPAAGLISVKGTLYGTTPFGGLYGTGYGTVFSLDPETGAETVLWSFGNGTDGASPSAGLISVNGMLYGTTNIGGQYEGGTVFSLDPETGTETVVYSFCGRQNCTDGGVPQAGLIAVNGTLYGTTGGGGQFGGGAVFSLDPGTDTETAVWSFGNGTDGVGPQAGLISVNGTLYGTTVLGGAHGGGTVFSLTP